MRELETARPPRPGGGDPARRRGAGGAPEGRAAADPCRDRRAAGLRQDRAVRRSAGERPRRRSGAGRGAPRAISRDRMAEDVSRRASKRTACAARSSRRVARQCDDQSRRADLSLSALGERDRRRRRRWCARLHRGARRFRPRRALDAAIDALDNRIPGRLQLELYRAVEDLLLDRTRLVLAECLLGQAALARSRPPMARRALRLPMCSARSSRRSLAEPIAGQAARYEAAAYPPTWHGGSHRCRRSPRRRTSPGCGRGRRLGQAAATAYFAVADVLAIAGIKALAKSISTADTYDRLALDGALEMLGLCAPRDRQRRDCGRGRGRLAAGDAAERRQAGAEGPSPR